MAPSISNKSRIAPVDGLRAVAVLGVIWAHVWAFSGNPALSIGQLSVVNLDLNRAVAIIGTGVDLFFVISGFCMYLMYARKQTSFDLNNYVIFLKKRWLRIAPAFYVVALTAAIGFVVAGKPFPWYDLLAHMVFMHTVLPDTGGIVAPFWSLATEWHFYLFLPFFIFASTRFGFWPVVTAAIFASLGFRTWMYNSPAYVEAFWKAQLPSRLVEFAWGICIARFYTLNKIPPKFLQGGMGFLIGVTIAYAGRMLMVTEVVNWIGRFGYISKIAAEPVLTLGYAIILWNLISSNSLFQKCLSHPFPQAIGRWSYSMYLWHWWIVYWISQFLVNKLGSTPLTQYIALTFSLFILIPLSRFSYAFLEAYYFRVQQSRSSA